MRASGIVLIYLFLASTSASILAWLLVDVLAYPYEKIFSRALLLFTALGLVPLWRVAGLNAADVGLKPARWAHLFWAYPIGLLLVLPLVLVFFVVGYRVFDDRIVYASSHFVQFVLTAVVSGLLVGLFEETLFRGVMLCALRKVTKFVPAMVISSLLYASVHFLRQDSLMSDSHSWYSGYAHVLQAFTGFAQLTEIWDSFAALFLLGLLFCWVRQYVSLWACVGLHAAWVFAIRIFKEITVRDIVNPYQVLVGSYDNFVGILVAIWLVFIFVVITLRNTVTDR